MREKIKTRRIYLVYLFTIGLILALLPGIIKTNFEDDTKRSDLHISKPKAQTYYDRTYGQYLYVAYPAAGNDEIDWEVDITSGDVVVWMMDATEYSHFINYESYTYYIESSHMIFNINTGTFTVPYTSPNWYTIVLNNFPSTTAHVQASASKTSNGFGGTKIYYNGYSYRYWPSNQLKGKDIIDWSFEGSNWETSITVRAMNQYNYGELAGGRSYSFYSLSSGTTSGSGTFTVPYTDYWYIVYLNLDSQQLPTDIVTSASYTAGGFGGTKLNYNAHIYRSFGSNLAGRDTISWSFTGSNTAVGITAMAMTYTQYQRFSSLLSYTYYSLSGGGSYTSSGTFTVPFAENWYIVFQNIDADQQPTDIVATATSTAHYFGGTPMDYNAYIYETSPLITGNSVDWSFEGSNTYVGVTVMAMTYDQFDLFVDGYSYTALTLSGGGYYYDSGIFTTPTSDIWYLVFWNHDSDQQRTDLVWDCSIVDDSYEPNQSPVGSPVFSEGTYSNLVAMDDDWYQISLAEGEEVTVTITFLNAMGDLDLGLFDSSQTLLISSTTTADYEEITWLAGYSGTYYIFIDAYEPNPYYILDIAIEIPVDTNITIISPTSETIWTTGTTATITWTTDVAMETMTLCLFYGLDDPEAVWYEEVDNTGSYSFTVPIDLVASTEYFITISETGNVDNTLTISDTFEIVEGETKVITVTSPTSSTKWNAGQSYVISWTTEGSIPYVNIYLFKNLLGQNPEMWVIAENTVNGGMYTVNIPANFTGGTDYYIVVEDSSNSDIFGYSNAFEIIGENTQTSTTPSDTDTGPTDGGFKIPGYPINLLFGILCCSVLIISWRIIRQIRKRN